jgi:transcriptional regulator with XRE-family HTH domain
MGGDGVKRLAHVAFVRMGNETERPLAELARDAATGFGARVRELRKAIGMNQEDLAEALSLSGRSYHQTTIAKLESGSRPTSIEELYLLAVIFDVPVTDLVVVQDDQNMEGHRELIRLTAEIRRLTEELAESTEHLEEAKRQYEELTRSMGAGMTGDSRRAEGRFALYVSDDPPDAPPWLTTGDVTYVSDDSPDAPPWVTTGDVTRSSRAARRKRRAGRPTKDAEV